jgi:hypothetical protein
MERVLRKIIGATRENPPRQEDRLTNASLCGTLATSRHPHNVVERRGGRLVWTFSRPAPRDRPVISTKEEEPWVKATTAKRTTRRTKKSSRTRSRRPSRRTRSRDSRRRGGADDFPDSIVHLRQPMAESRRRCGATRGSLNPRPVGGKIGCASGLRTSHDPRGVTAISRGWSRATPPEAIRDNALTPTGSQPWASTPSGSSTTQRPQPRVRCATRG